MGIIRKILSFLSSVEGIWSAVSLLFVIWAVVSGFLSGLAAYKLIIIFLCVAAICLFIGYYLVKGIDYYEKTRGKKKALNDLADHLQELLDVGHEYIPIQEIAGMWVGENVTNVWHYNPKMKRIKTAARAGKIRPAKQGQEKIGQVTPVNVEDVIKLLRNGEL